MKAQYASVTITPERIRDFLAYMESKGRSRASVEGYRRILMELYEYLPEDKQLTADTAEAWRAHLEARDLLPRTLNVRISVWNSFMAWLGYRGWQMNDFQVVTDDDQPTLTREEYLRLLSAAKAIDDEKTYLIIKAMGGAGLHSQEMPQLTVEAIRAGVMQLNSHNSKASRTLRLPKLLQKEMLAYAKQKGITEGPLFVTATGRVLGRGQMNRLILRAGAAARVAEDRCNPRCLWKMYQDTQDRLWEQVSAEQRRLYDEQLAAEQRQIGRVK